MNYTLIHCSICVCFTLCYRGLFKFVLLLPFLKQEEIYWTDWTVKAVLKANKLTGHGVQKVVSDIPGILDLKVLHRISQQGLIFSFIDTTNVFIECLLCLSAYFSNFFSCLPSIAPWAQRP